MTPIFVLVKHTVVVCDVSLLFSFAVLRGIFGGASSFSRPSSLCGVSPIHLCPIYLTDTSDRLIDESIRAAKTTTRTNQHDSKYDGCMGKIG